LWQAPPPPPPVGQSREKCPTKCVSEGSALLEVEEAIVGSTFVALLALNSFSRTRLGAFLG
jgi:hypothetical protein